MKIFFLFICCTISYVNSLAQSTILDSVQTNEEILVDPDILPEFPGGLNGLRTYLSKNMRYPIEAAKNHVEGRVFVNFVIDAKGQVTDVKISKGIGYKCDEEAVRVVQRMPVWKPGTQSGKPVPVRYTLPITFSLPKQMETQQPHTSSGW